VAIKTIPKRYKFARRTVYFFLAASFLLLILSFIRSENLIDSFLNGDPTKNVHFKYFLASLIGIVFWGTVLRLNDDIKLNTVMVTTSLMCGLYFIEIVLSVTGPIRVAEGNNTEMRLKAAKAAGLEYDARTKYQVYKDLKNEGIDIVPAYTAADKTYEDEEAKPLYPISGVSKKTTLYCNENGKYSIFMSDRYGFNNPDSEWDSPKAEWVLTGDSFTQGACVQPEDTIGGQIRLITGDNLINLGLGGNGPLIELAALKEYAEFLKPKIVLWIYYEGNDMLDLNKEKSAQILTNYLRPGFSQNLIHRQNEIDSMLGKHISKTESILKHAHMGIGDGAKPSPVNTKSTLQKLLKKQLEILRLKNLRLQIGFDDPVDPLFTEILAKARNQIEAWGGKLYFVYLPEFLRYATKTKNHSLFRKRGKIIGLVKKLNLPIIDIHDEVFSEHPDPLSLFPFRLPYHYTAETYRMIAKKIAARVTNSQ